jgi:hypothetical protein
MRLLQACKEEGQKQRLQNSVQGRLSRFRKTGTTGLQALIAPDGSFATSAEDMARVLRDHWQTIFSAKPVDDAALEFWSRATTRHATGVASVADEWAVGAEHVAKAISHSNDSSPGPDGIPYQAWRLTRELATPILADVLSTMAFADTSGQQRDAPLFNSSTLCCLPKSSEAETPDGLPAYQAAATRPLNVGNTDNRILAGACRYAWDRAVARRVHPHQRGFLRNRSMVQNVLDVDEGLRTFACWDTSVAVFWDFRAAFPSISRRFMRRMLRCAGLPIHAQRIIDAFYLNTCCEISIGGGRFPGFPMEAGIRQGCPLSPMIFVLTTNALIAELAKQPDFVIRGYADDTATLVRNWPRQQAYLRETFSSFSQASSMEINWDKSVAVPLGTCARAAIASTEARLPEDLRLRVETSAKYLGVYLGPDARSRSWDGPRKKFLSRLDDFDWRRLGWSMLIKVYNVYLLSTLLYVGQYYEPDAATLAAEDTAIRRIFGGPAGGITLEEAQTLQVNFHFPVAPKNLRHVCDAAKLRLWFWENRQGGGIQAAQSWQRIRAAGQQQAYMPDCPHHFLWWHSPIQRTLIEVVDRLQQQGVTLQTITMQTLRHPPSSLEDVLRIKKNTQRVASRLLTRRTALKALPKLRTRLARLLPLRDGPRAQGRTQAMLKRLRKHCPPRVQAAVISTILNRWCTDRRLRQGQTPRPCLLCGLLESDDMRHYAGCMKVRRLFQRMAGGDLPGHLLGHWLGQHPGTLATQTRHAITCYATYRAVHTLRMTTRRTPVDTDRLLWQMVYEATKGSARLRSVCHGQEHNRKRPSQRGSAVVVA